MQMRLRTLVGLALTTAVVASASEGTCPAGGCVEFLQLPRIIIGCWQLLERDADRAAAVRTLTSYAEAGFTAFDTADIYGPSETILGDFRRQWVASHPQASALRFFTKYVTDTSGAREADRINSQSLRNLGIDAADLVQFHWWSLSKDGSKRDFLRAARELDRLKQEGKIRHLAGCNMDTTNLKLMVDDGMAIEANQVQYSLVDRRAEVRHLKYCKEQGIKLTVFGVVAGGLLSDRFLGLTRNEAQSKLDSVSRRMYDTSLQRWSTDWNLFQQLLGTLKAVGHRKEPQLPIAAVACLWALHQMETLGAGGALILGVRDAGHLAEHTALLNGEARLDVADMEEIRAVLDLGNKPVGDIWYQERGWA